ncbi:hypothetical protein SAMN03080601_03178 [Alkalitalea saponilacus]|uniref:Uncharacterized protein n=1 Tax=Alkalitalea saponilacus TaxID=889453 RepID=A0A1T5HT98_9BACT|nr:hypothetical protein SAMN03080601_03178 [Alkalitalea saponilacus]
MYFVRCKCISFFVYFTNIAWCCFNRIFKSVEKKTDKTIGFDYMTGVDLAYVIV